MAAIEETKLTSLPGRMERGRRYVISVESRQIKSCDRTSRGVEGVSPPPVDPVDFSRMPASYSCTVSWCNRSSTAGFR
jgi:hypothetical protein